MTLPRVTIAIPCLNEERHIAACVTDAATQDYPRNLIEILVADGGSSDGTRKILSAMARRDRRIRVLDNPTRIQATGLNVAIRSSSGDVIVRMNAHARYAKDYVRASVRALARTGADNVGGPFPGRAMRSQHPGTRFQRAVSLALESKLGLGGAAHHEGTNGRWVATVWCGAFRRRAFERAGLFDPNAITNEDAELNHRIRAAGGGVYLDPSIAAHLHPRTSHREVARQFFRYGFGRARTMLKHGSLTWRPLVPAAALASGAAAMLFAPRVAYAMLASYAGASLEEAVRLGSHEGVIGVATIASVFPVMHVAQACGLAAGLVHHALHPSWSTREELLPSRDALRRDVA